MVGVVSVSLQIFITSLFLLEYANSEGTVITENLTLGNFKSARQPRTIKELNMQNMQNMQSCLSMLMCRMGEGTMNTNSLGTKNQDLLKQLLESLMNRDNGKSGEEESDEGNQDDEPLIEILDNSNHDNEVHQNYEPIARRQLRNRSGKMFGISYPMPKHRTSPSLMGPQKDKTFSIQSHKDLQEMTIALQNPVRHERTSSSPCNNNPRKSRLLKITWIRNRYPITIPSTTTPSPMSVAAVTTSMSQQSCPYDFSELQSMLFGAFNNILMTGGGLAGQALMQQQQQQPPPKQEMPNMMQLMQQAGLGGAGVTGIESLMTKNGGMNKGPYTIYANIKLPLTISTDASEMQDKVSKLHSQQYSQMFGSESKIPGVAAVGEKIRYSDFFRRRGIAKLKENKSPTSKTPVKVIELKAESEEEESEEISQEEMMNYKNFLKMDSQILKLQPKRPALTRVLSDFRHYLKSLQNVFAQLQNNFFTRFQSHGFKMLAKRHLRLASKNHNPAIRTNKYEEWFKFPKIRLTSEEEFSNNSETDESSEA